MLVKFSISLERNGFADAPWGLLDQCQMWHSVSCCLFSQLLFIVDEYATTWQILGRTSVYCALQRCPLESSVFMTHTHMHTKDLFCACPCCVLMLLPCYTFFSCWNKSHIYKYATLTRLVPMCNGISYFCVRYLRRTWWNLTSKNFCSVNTQATLEGLWSKWICEKENFQLPCYVNVASAKITLALAINVIYDLSLPNDFHTGPYTVSSLVSLHI